MDGDWSASWDLRTPRIGRRLCRAALLDLIVLAALGSLFEGVLLGVGYTTVFPPDVPSDRHGYREVAFSTEKPAGQYRLLVFGDSTTFGTGVNSQETYAKQLQARLNSGLSRECFQVINAGGEGASLHRLRTELERHCELAKPDTVLLTLSPPAVAMQRIDSVSDVGEQARQGFGSRAEAWKLAMSLAPQRVHAWLYQRSRTYQFLQNEVRFSLYRVGLLEERLDKPKGAIFAYAFETERGSEEPRRRVEEVYASLGRDLDAIQETLRRHQVGLFVAAIPSQFMISERTEDNVRRVDKTKMRIDPYERFREMARARGLPFIDVQAGLKSSRLAMVEGNVPWDALYIRYDYTHLNSAGHGVVAEVVENQLRRDPGIARRADLPLRR